MSGEHDHSYQQWEGQWRPDTPRFRAGKRAEPWTCGCGTLLPPYRANCLGCGQRRPSTERRVNLVNLGSHRSATGEL